MTILTLEKKSKIDWSKQDKLYFKNTSKYHYQNYANTWMIFENYQKECFFRHTSFCKVFKNKIIFLIYYLLLAITKKIYKCIYNVQNITPFRI